MHPVGNGFKQAKECASGRVSK